MSFHDIVNPADKSPGSMDLSLHTKGEEVGGPCAVRYAIKSPLLFMYIFLSPPRMLGFSGNRYSRVENVNLLLKGRPRDPWVFYSLQCKRLQQVLFESLIVGVEVMVHLRCIVYRPHQLQIRPAFLRRISEARPLLTSSPPSSARLTARLDKQRWLRP